MLKTQESHHPIDRVGPGAHHRSIDAIDALGLACSESPISDDDDDDAVYCSFSEQTLYTFGKGKYPLVKSANVQSECGEENISYI